MKRVPSVPVRAAVEHKSIERQPMLNISAFMSPQLEFESVFKTFIPDVDSDDNRLSVILDQALEFLDGVPIPHSAMVLGMDAQFRRKAYGAIIKALVQTAGEDSLDDLVLEPREVQKHSLSYTYGKVSGYFNFGAILFYHPRRNCIW